MQIDWTISIGTIATGLFSVLGAYAAAMRVYHLFDKRMDKVESAIEGHTDRIAETDKLVLQLVQEVARIVGAMNPVQWVRPMGRPHAYDSNDPGRLP